MTDYGGYGSDAEIDNDFGTGDGSGDRGGGRGFGANTGSTVMDAIINAMPGGWLLGAPDWLAQQSWGDGIAGRGSSNDFTDGGGASAGGNDYAGNIDDIISQLINRETAPTTPIRVSRGGTEGGRRPSGRGSMRSQYMPAYRGISAGRGRTQPRTGGGEPYVDSPVFPNGNSINNILEPHVDNVGSMIGDVGSLVDAQSGNNALSALASFMPQANEAAASKAGGMTDYLSKLVSRGDIAEDGASINAATGPRLMKGRNTALSSIMMGKRVPNNLYDMQGLGADIGARQGAQNVDVRGRTPSRSRRF